MATAQHEELARGRWQQLTLVEQLANVGSEVERALQAREQNRVDRMDHAITRALELFDLTATDKRWHGTRRRETLRAREAFCGVFFWRRWSARDRSLSAQVLSPVRRRRTDFQTVSPNQPRQLVLE